MRRNVAAGIGSNEQGEYCRAALQRWIAKSRDINRLLYFTLLYTKIQVEQAPTYTATGPLQYAALPHNYWLQITRKRSIFAGEMDLTTH